MTDLLEAVDDLTLPKPVKVETLRHSRPWAYTSAQ